MALGQLWGNRMTAIKTVTTESGITVLNAVHRIESVIVGYKNNVTYTVRVYVSLDKPSFCEFQNATEYRGGDVYSECYEHLNINNDYIEA